jgi:GDP-L-fucose synthase
VSILVTGATGFLGTALCRTLTGAGHEVVGLGSMHCDLTRQGALDPWNDSTFDRIYHLAAWTQAGDFCLHHPGEQWLINQQINTNVLAWWQTRQPRAQLIAIGTSCAYSPDQELVEENYFTGAPIGSLFTYAMTKRMLHAGLLALRKQYGLRALTVVPSTLYGPGYHKDGRQMHFIFDIIRKVVRGKETGEPVVLWGDGYQRRELIHVDDFIRATLQLAERPDIELVNIGAGEEHTIRYFTQLVCNHLGYDFARVQFDTNRYVGARSKCLRIDRLRQLLPDFQRTPLAEGLRGAIDSFVRERPVLARAL